MINKYLKVAGWLFAVFSCFTDEKVEWVSTTNDQPWALQTGGAVTTGNVDESAILIVTDSARQIIDGFGGCFNELGWDALQALTEKNKQTVAKNRFDTNSGCRFNMFRMPIGANDYAVN